MAETESEVPARRSRSTNPASPADPLAANDRGELGLEALARAILARELRPRTADIRRLAEALLTGLAGKKPKKPKKTRAPADGVDAKPGKKDRKKNKKLAKIPAQKAKK